MQVKRKLNMSTNINQLTFVKAIIYYGLIHYTLLHARTQQQKAESKNCVHFHPLCLSIFTIYNPAKAI